MKLAAVALLMFTSAAFAQVTSVAGRTGDVYLDASDINGLSLAAISNVGVGPGFLLKLDDDVKMPAVDGSQLTHVNSERLQGRAMANAAPTDGEVLVWDARHNEWTPGTCRDVNAKIKALENRIKALERR